MSQRSLLQSERANNYDEDKSAPASSPATDRSSSSSGQCKPMPPPPISQRERCSAVAANRRGNHASGTPMIRPSIKCTFIKSSVNSTDFASADVGRKERALFFVPLAKVLMPGLQQFNLMLANKPFNFVQITAVKTVISHQAHRIEPKLGLQFGSFYMDVWRLVSLVAEKEK